MVEPLHNLKVFFKVMLTRSLELKQSKIGMENKQELLMLEIHMEEQNGLEIGVINLPFGQVKLKNNAGGLMLMMALFG